MKSATLLLFLWVFPLTSAWAQVGYKVFRPGAWESRATFDYRYSDANYDNNGGQVELINGGTYQLLNMDFSSRYTMNRSWAVFGGLGVGYAESKGTDATRTGGALTSGRLGAEWNSEFFDFLDLIPRFSYLLPFERISPDQDSLITSEGVDEMLFDLHMQTAFDSFRLYGSVGYLIRGEGRSNLLPWSAGIEIPFSKFVLGGRLKGFESISDDGDAGNDDAEGQRINTLTRVNAGSLKFYSVNPGLLDSEVYMVFRLGRSFRVGVFGGLTLTGSNTASEFHGGASLSFHFNPAPVRRRSVREDRLSIDPYVDQFQEDTSDGVDQSLFRPSRPAPPPQQPSAPPHPPRPRGPSPEQLKKQKEEEEMRQLQRQLREAEMTIELKVDPKYKKTKSTKKKKR